MAWAALAAAGLLEVVWASLLKRAFSEDLFITAITTSAMLGSFMLLRYAMNAIPVGTAYAVWTGIGAAGAAIIGVALMGEPAGALRLGCIGLIIAGVVGLKLTA